MATERTVLVRLRADVNQFKRAMRDAADSVDKTNDRTAWLAQSVLALGPTIAPLGAAVVPVFSTIATQMTMATVAAGTLGLAFNGVGDSLTALNDYQLEPSVANLEKLNAAMAKIGPEGEEFVRFLDSLGPAFGELSNTAREGLFPGMTEGLRDLMTLMPEFNILVGRTAETLGELSADTGGGLASDRFTEFFDYLSTDGQAILSDMGRTLGNFFEGFAGMVVGFGPLTDDLSSGLLNASRNFAVWSAGLDENQGFQEFVDYIREAGPVVLDFLGSLGGALVSVLQAAAPVGEVTLKVLTPMLDVISAIAKTPFAPWLIGATAAMSAYGRASALGAVTTSGMLRPLLMSEGGLIRQTKAAKNSIPTLSQFGTVAYRAGQSTKYASDQTTKARTSVGAFGKSALPAATAITLLGVQATGMADKVGLSNTATMALAGTLLGPWGTAMGAGVGLLLDAKDAAQGFADALAFGERALATNDIDQMGNAIAELKEKLVDARDVTGKGDFFSDALQGFFAGGDAKRADELIGSLQMKLNSQAFSAGAADARMLGEGFKGTAAGLETASQSADEFRLSLERVNNVLEGRANLRDYRDSLREVAQAIKDNGKAFGDGTAAADANEAALDRVASTALKVSEAIVDPVFRSAFLDTARTEFIKAARAAGATRQEARKLARQVGLLNQVKGTPKVDMNTDAFDVGMQHVKTQMAIITGKGITIPVSIKRDSTGLYPAGFGPGKADGGTIPGARYPYGDKVLLWGAPGEEIITNRNGEADRFRADRTAGRIPGYADGGTIPGGFSSYIRNDLGMRVPDTLREWNQALRVSTRVVERETAERDELISRKRDLVSNVSGAFKSDLFGEKPSNWSFMSQADRQKWLTQNPVDIANRDAASAGEFEGYLKTLAKNGLDGDAFAALAGTGDVERARAFSMQTPAQIAAFEKSIALQARKANSVGAYAGGISYDPRLAEANASLREANGYQKAIVREVAESRKDARRNARTVANAVNGANSHRAGQLRVAG